MEKYYSIEVEERRGAVTIDTKEDYESSRLLSMNCHLIEKNQFHVVDGKKFFDVLMFAEHFAFFAISGQFRKLLVDNGVKGWNSFPIKIVGTELAYYILVVETFVGGIVNLERRNKYLDEFYEVDMSPKCEAEIFSMKDTLHIICTSRVKQLIEKAKISNISFKEILIVDSSKKLRIV